MSRTFLLIFFCLLLAAPCFGQNEPLVVRDSSRWQDAIDRFEAADELQAPPKNAFLFVGSSSIRKWDLPLWFPELATINRGFGGSQLIDSVHFIDSLVLKHEPQAVIIYAGDNDLNAGKTPERVFADFAQFVAIMQEQRPNTTLHYIGVKPSIKRWKLIDQVRRTNALIQGYCAMHDKLHFIDIDDAMLDESGKPRVDLFEEDGLHLSAAGYEIWKEKVLQSLNSTAELPSEK